MSATPRDTQQESTSHISDPQLDNSEADLVSECIEQTSKFINRSKRERKGLGRQKLLLRTRSGKIINNSKREQFKKTEAIEDSDIDRRKAAGDCLRCAWLSDRKGSHHVRDCKKRMKLEIRTAIRNQHPDRALDLEQFRNRN